MDKLSAIKIFIRVAEAGSFSAVAKETGSSQSAVSKSVAALERHLGVLLLARTTRSFSITDEGRQYLDEVRRLVGEMNEVEAALKHNGFRLKGELRVAASVAYGRKVLMPIIAEFLAIHPELKIDLNLNDGFIDIVEQGIDIAIRVGDLPDSSLIAKKIGTTHRALIASQKYIARVENTIGLPCSPMDLTAHNCIIYTGLSDRNHWDFVNSNGQKLKVRISGNLQSNSSEIIRAACLSGLGLCYAPRWLFKEELLSGDVITLFAGLLMQEITIHAVCAPQRLNSSKVKAFIETLTEAL